MNTPFSSYWPAFAWAAAGATANRTGPARAADVVNIADFGASPGLTDNGPFIQAALNSGYTRVVVPPGSFPFVTPVTIPTGVSLVGTSKYASALVYDGSGNTAISVTYGTLTTANITISDLTLAATSTSVNNTGIGATLAREFDVVNVIVTGFLTAVSSDRGLFNKLVNVTCRGTASQKAGNVRLLSSLDTTYNFYGSVENLSFDNLGAGVNSPALYMRRCDSWQVHNVSMNSLVVGGAANGIVIENDSQNNKFDQVTMMGPATGVLFQRGTGVAVSPSYTTLNDVDIDQSSVHAIDFNQCNWTTVVGGNITSSGVVTNISGIIFGALCSWCTIIGQTVTGLNAAGGNAYEFAVGAANVTITGGFTDTCNRSVIFNGAVVAANITNNTWTNSVNTPVAGTLTGSNNILANNVGYPAELPVGVALTATGTIQTNAFLLLALVNEFTTVASGTGALLQPNTIGVTVMVANFGASTLLLYPNTGARINRLAVNAPISVLTNTTILMISTSTTQWYSA